MSNPISALGPQTLQSAQAPSSPQEVTQDTPAQNDDQMKQVLAKYGKKLIDLAQKKRTSWEFKRRAIILKVLKNKEMLKGNQNLGIYPGTFDSFDPMDQYSNFIGGADMDNGDRTMDARPHNFYQMVEKAFVSGLGSQIPKTRSFPANAEVEEDRETAKVASRVQEIIEDRNKAKTLLKQELMELFTSGCYFKYTRYVVDATRTGTHKQPVWNMTKGEVLPARFICFECGQATPANDMADRKAACPTCGAAFTQENFFQSHVDDLPQPKLEDVPNGMVLWGVYGPMHVDTDPDSSDLINVPLLNLAEEVSVGWLRSTFEEYWEKFAEGQNAGAAGEAMERQYRDMLTTPSGYNTWFSYNGQNKPTYNRTWFQPMLFAEIDGGKAEADELKEAFPNGCMLCWVADMPLQLRQAKLVEEWTWCGSEQKGFGLYPNPVGDPAVPIQERINDCVNKIDEYMDRLACGILLALEGYIDTKAMNNKVMYPGLLNPVALRKGTPLSSIQDLIFQVRGEIDNAIFTYVATLKQDLQLLVGTPPQTFGAGTQEGVETLGGQQMQYNAGMMKMGLSWEFICEEHAEAAANAIKCAAQNMTEDWFNVVSDRTEEFRNEYVHLESMKGSVHVKSDTEQGFPMSYADQKQFWETVVDNAEQIWAQMLLSVPENMDAVLRFCAPPGTKAPLGAMQGKMLRIIDQLVRSEPLPSQDPMTGAPLLLPSVFPNKYLDDLPTLVKLIPRWAQEHWDQLENNEKALDNLVAYFKMCVVYQKELEAEQQLVGGQPTPPPGKSSSAQTQPQMTGAQA